MKPRPTVGGPKPGRPAEESALPLESEADEVALVLKRAGRWSIGPRFSLG